MVRSAWFVKGHTPNETDTKTYSLEDLTSFSASISSSKEIEVQFAAYSGQYKVNYVVTIEHNGQTVATETLESNSGKLSYQPSEAGVYKITGYYKEKDGSMTSNKLSREVTIQEEKKPEETQQTTETPENSSNQQQNNANQNNNNQTTNNQQQNQGNQNTTTQTPAQQ